MRNRLLTLIFILALAGCTSGAGTAEMFPDYRGVTVPACIAPLNFSYTGAAGIPLTVFSAPGVKVRVIGRNVVVPERRWAGLTAAAADGEIAVESRLAGKWTIHVSSDPIDSYLTYRLIEPGYEVWDRVEIKERDIRSFEERTLASHSNTGNACMNCHIHKGPNSMFYLRGKNGGAVLSQGNTVRKLELKREGMLSGTVYGDIHPSGRWGVFSTNVIIPGFHTQPGLRLEVFDTASDLCVADFSENRMLTQAEFCRPDRLETFPCFSSDGSQIFYCAADSVKLPEDIRKLKYSLYRAPFDETTGAIGKAEVIWDAASRDASVCHPKASPDGRRLLYTVADYGTFPIWHRECRLEMMDLQSGETTTLESLHADASDTYHSWSSGSRWFVFASKRGDGQYGKPYICHVDSEGNCAKPFLLPQKDPRHYLKTFKSCNIPDFGTRPAPYDSESIGELWANMETEKFN